MSGETISLYLPTPLINEIDEEAGAENRSRSNMGATLIQEALRDRRFRRAAQQVATAARTGAPYPAMPEAPADSDNGGE